MEYLSGHLATSLRPLVGRDPGSTVPGAVSHGPFTWL
jgi:hypothetical protein